MFLLMLQSLHRCCAKKGKGCEPLEPQKHLELRWQNVKLTSGKVKWSLFCWAAPKNMLFEKKTQFWLGLWYVHWLLLFQVVQVKIRLQSRLRSLEGSLALGQKASWQNLAPFFSLYRPQERSMICMSGSKCGIPNCSCELRWDFY